jgi:hypothetical protein
MSTDRVFRAACLDLEFCSKIWESKETARYPQAEAAYRRAVELRDTYFPNPEPTKNQNQNTP